jgi:flagellar hook-basal body complex protein FliE
MSNTISPIRILPAEIELDRAPEKKGSAFMETLRGAMDGVEQAQTQAQDKIADFLAGNGMDVHDAMIAVEKADLSFQLMIEVRNKIVQAYQEIARMQF